MMSLTFAARSACAAAARHAAGFHGAALARPTNTSWFNDDRGSAGLTSSASLFGSALPKLPKKPAPAFVKFFMEVRGEILAGGASDIGSVSKIAGQRWGELPEEKRRAYKDDYLKELQAWKEKVASVEEHLAKANLLDDVRAQQQEERLDKASKRAKREKKKLLQELGGPKRPPSAYILFVKEEMKAVDLPKSLKEVSEFSTKAGAKWREMSSESKARFVQQAEKLSAEYLERKQAWWEGLDEDQRKELEGMNKRVTKLNTKKKLLKSKESD